MYRWDKLVDKYIRECAIRGLATSTLQIKIRELYRFGGWLKRRRPRPKLEAINHEYILGYIRARGSFRSKSTVYRIISDIRCMGEFLKREGYWQENPLKWMQGPKIDPRRQLPSIINKKQMKSIWKAAAEITNEYNRIRCISVLSLLYGTGMRLGELENLKLNDYRSEEKTIKINGTKAGKERILPLSEFAVLCLEQYVSMRHNLLLKMKKENEKSLFVSVQGNRYTRSRISHMLKRLAKRAGLANLTAHQFRHTCATDLLEEGVGLAEVQNILGHSYLGSTCRYVRITDPERIRAMKAHPVNKMING